MTPLEAPAFEPSRADLYALIDWLALPYLADPMFVSADERPVPGSDPTVRLRLQATWEAVVGTRGATAGSVWHRCGTCGQWQSIHQEVECGT
jgi:hypothetical protein